MSVTADERQLLRKAAARASARFEPSTDPGPWQLQTSNSFRRIGTPEGDGDVLSATNHPVDGHPDLLAAPGVLEYIVAAQPRAVVSLLDDLEVVEDELRRTRVVTRFPLTDDDITPIFSDAVPSTRDLLERIATLQDQLIETKDQLIEALTTAKVAKDRSIADLRSREIAEEERDAAVHARDQACKERR